LEYIFNLNKEDLHLIIEFDGDSFLLDTGAPYTLANKDTIKFCNLDYTAAKNMTGITVSKISELIKRNIDVLLGNDVLSQYNIRISRKTNSVLVTQENISDTGIIIPFELLMGVPVIELKVENKNKKFFLDTGAQLSYISQQTIANHRLLEVKKDFYPLLGEFETPVYELQTNIAGENLKMHFGVLPELIGMTLTFAGVDGIIGTELFNHYDIVINNHTKNLNLIKI
jgi:hypothetical protein